MRAARLLCYALAIGCGLYFWGPLVDAKWGLIDDHEVMFFVGTGERMPVSRLPAVLEETELSPQSNLPRFRPSYYVLRMAEAMAWGKSAALWYAFRIATAVFFMLAVTHVCLQAVGPILTAGFVPFAFSSPYWSDVFGRAGVGETYCALGVALIAFGWNFDPRRQMSTTRLAVVLLGVVIAAGAKENFVLLGALPLWLVVSRRTTPAGKAMAVAVLAYLAWIAFTILPRVNAVGTDINANDASPLYRLKLLSSLLSLPPVPYWLGGLVVLLVASFIIRPLRVHFYIACLLFAIYASQFVFYAGQWPRGQDRYLFPGILAYHGAILVGFAAVVDTARTLAVPAPAVAGLQIAAAAALVFWSVDNFAYNRSASYKTVADTTAFGRNFDTVAGNLKANPSRALVINSHSFNDFEPVVSIYRFLRAYDVANPIAVRVDHKPSTPQSREAILSQALEKISREGQTGMFVPLATVDQARCYSVGMSGPPLATCDGGGLVLQP